MRYLSPEWLVAANDAVAKAAESAPPGRVVIDQHVEGASSYRIMVDSPVAEIVPLDDAKVNDDGADAVFRQSMETAAMVAQGHTDTHQAFLLGHIRFTGDIETLINRRSLFQWLQGTLAPVMATTTFDD